MVADGLCRDLVRVRLRARTIITSEPLLEELRATLRGKFKADPAKLPLVAALRDAAEIIAPAVLGERARRDEDDDVVLATAVAGKPRSSSPGTTICWC